MDNQCNAHLSVVIGNNQAVQSVTVVEFELEPGSLFNTLQHRHDSIRVVNLHTYHRRQTNAVYHAA